MLQNEATHPVPEFLGVFQWPPSMLGSDSSGLPARYCSSKLSEHRRAVYILSTWFHDLPIHDPHSDFPYPAIPRRGRKRMLSAPQGGTQRRWRNTRRPTPASTHFIYQYGSFMGKEKKISGSLPKRSPPHLSFVTCITATVILIHLFGTAGASIRAADTFLTAFFGLIDIQSGSCNDYNKNTN